MRVRERGYESVSRTKLHCDLVIGTRTEFDVPLDLSSQGTEFQRTAWAALAKIPFGETKSYKAQAQLIGKPGAIRAVGSANGKNPVPIILPCHRVIGSDGGLHGFAGGLDKKRLLLDHEVDMLAKIKRSRTETHQKHEQTTKTVTNLNERSD